MTEQLTAGEMHGAELDDRRVEEILDAMGDPYARDVLAAICREPRSAQDIATMLEHSLQTVYRRIDLLEEHGLVTSQIQIAGDGNHYRVFEAAFDNVLISVEDEQYDVRIYQRENLPDRFTQLWSELSRA